MTRFLVLAASLALCGGCVLHADQAVRAEGPRIVETRDLPPFSAVSLSGAVRFEAAAGAVQRVTVEAEKNVVGLIDADVRGSTLRIAPREPYEGGSGVTVRITVPSLTEATVGGSCTGRIEGINGGSFRVELSGAGALEATGAVESLEIVVSGSGAVDFRGLAARRATIDVTGAGRIVLDVSDELSARVSGAGDVRYTGHPARVERKVLGVGRIEPL